MRAGLATLVLLALAGYVFLHYQTGGARAPECVVTGTGTGEPYRLQPQQAANAATIQAVASSRGLPERAVTIALATAMQESSLRNIDYGDRDSLGLFQQRPSMGWGSEEEIMDPVYAAGQFYDHLVQIPGYTTMPLTEAAQMVQRSAFPDEYAKHEPQAAMLTAALTGRAAASLYCTSAMDPAPGDPGEIRGRLAHEFGDAVRTDHSGRDITVEVPEPELSPQGWEVAHWAVAHAAEFGVERIVHRDRVWEARRSVKGWQAAREQDTADGLLITVAP
ncbi:heavy metal transporter [Streptomyces sodiiphilus]|uniref:Heavy metal transporter n=1 Tax=Streptomyces sodiiphilus TaxID=226217 RepID=A0ABN2NVJ7_9ACTN